jgi:ADP-dependent NAD(P)H-hydrate dehydratase / NAD(P)H-hydrate epimerase
MSMNNMIRTVSETRNADIRAVESGTFDAQGLVRHAGQALFHALDKSGHVKSEATFVVFAGPGSNGLDACVVAHLLASRVRSVRVFDLFSKNRNRKEAILSEGPSPVPLEDGSRHKTVKEALSQATHVLDGIFGSGFKGDLKEPATSPVNMINGSQATVIAIDCPTGLDLVNGRASDPCVKADLTLAIQTLKPGHLLFDGLDVTGQTEVVDIGLDPFFDSPPMIRLSKEMFGDLIASRPHNSHKYTYGHVMAVGGSPGMMGAPYLALMAALRSGAGLATGLYREADHGARFMTQPDIMDGSYSDALSLKERLGKAKTIVFGNGLGKSGDRTDIAETVLNHGVPVVVDADGISLIKPFLSSSEHEFIITPHVGECARLLDMDTKTLLEDPLGHVQSLASHSGTLVLLKGPATILTDGKKTVFSTFGNPGLAKAGTGDVLAGIIAARLSVTDDPFDAASQALFIHGMAADIARSRHGELSMTATDLIDCIPESVRLMLRRAV